jgi:hypothetical protein
LDFLDYPSTYYNIRSDLANCIAPIKKVLFCRLQIEDAQPLAVFRSSLFFISS